MLRRSSGPPRFDRRNGASAAHQNNATRTYLVRVSSGCRGFCTITPPNRLGGKTRGDRNAWHGSRYFRRTILRRNEGRNGRSSRRPLMTKPADVLNMLKEK